MHEKRMEAAQVIEFYVCMYSDKSRRKVNQTDLGQRKMYQKRAERTLKIIDTGTKEKIFDFNSKKPKKIKKLNYKLFPILKNDGQTLESNPNLYAPPPNPPNALY